MTRRDHLISAAATAAFAREQVLRVIHLLRLDGDEAQAESAGLSFARRMLRDADHLRERIDAALDGCER